MRRPAESATSSRAAFARRCSSRGPSGSRTRTAAVARLRRPAGTARTAITREFSQAIFSAAASYSGCSASPHQWCWVWSARRTRSAGLAGAPGSRGRRAARLSAFDNRDSDGDRDLVGIRRAVADALSRRIGVRVGRVAVHLDLRAAARLAVVAVQAQRFAHEEERSDLLPFSEGRSPPKAPFPRTALSGCSAQPPRGPRSPPGRDRDRCAARPASRSRSTAARASRGCSAHSRSHTCRPPCRKCSPTAVMNSSNIFAFGRIVCPLWVEVAQVGAGEVTVSSTGHFRRLASATSRRTRRSRSSPGSWRRISGALRCSAMAPLEPSAARPAAL